MWHFYSQRIPKKGRTEIRQIPFEFDEIRGLSKISTELTNGSAFHFELLLKLTYR